MDERFKGLGLARLPRNPQLLGCVREIDFLEEDVADLKTHPPSRARQQALIWTSALIEKLKEKE